MSPGRRSSSPAASISTRLRALSDQVASSLRGAQRRSNPEQATASGLLRFARNDGQSSVQPDRAVAAMAAEPAGGVAAERHDLGAAGAGDLDDPLHQPARRAGAAQLRRRLDMEDRQYCAVAPVIGE